ncbi:unnamed protein product [Prorocentrum cordatum]|uniref:RNA-directed RNA polymerase n=1 Tax=Prorocentrum cordatum TaxID=2364126 RepID=A0ABN9WU28_9DINO|nr:unnamed protein product [Polarella glacialis]
MLVGCIYLILTLFEFVASARLSTSRSMNANVEVGMWLLAWPDVVRVPIGRDDGQGGTKRVIIQPNSLALTATLRTILSDYEATEYVEPTADKVEVKGVMRVKAKFIWDAMRKLNRFEEEQRKFWAILSEGECNVGHLRYFGVKNFITFGDDEPIWIDETFEQVKTKGFFKLLPEFLDMYKTLNAGAAYEIANNFKVPLDLWYDGINVLGQGSMSHAIRAHMHLALLIHHGDKMLCHKAAREGNGARSKYDAIEIVNMFNASQFLKNDAHLKRACFWAIRSVLPPELAHEYCVSLEMESVTGRFPHKSTLSRMRGRVDVAWMLTARDLFQNMLDVDGIVVFPIPDSSPQGGRDYENAVLTIISRQNLVALRGLSSDLDRRNNTMTVEQRAADWTSEALIVKKIEEKIMRHVAPAVQLGFGRTNLSAKFHAIMHQLFLLSPSVDHFCKLVGSVPVWLSDQGTESGLARIEPIAVQDVLEFTRGCEVNDGEVDFAQPAAAPSRDFIKLTWSLEFDGALHLCRNAGNHLEDVMPDYKDAVWRLSKVSKLLDDPESKERLDATCFSSSPALKALVEPIKKFKGHCHVERWGTVANALLNITGNVEAALRYAWDAPKYTHGKKKGREELFNVKLGVLDDTINAPYWWAYWGMLEKIAQALFDVIRWCDSCSCHSDLLESLRGQECASNLAEEQIKTMKEHASKCPLRGMRCHDVCAGMLLDYVKDRLRYHIADFASNIPSDVSRGDAKRILDQMESGRMSNLSPCMTASVDTFWRFTQMVAKVSSGKAAVKLLGLERHPEAKQLETMHSSDKLFWDVIYRADPYTKYRMPLPKIKVKQVEAVELNGKAPPIDTADAACKRAAFVSHVIEKLSADGTMYCMPMQLTALMPLRKLLQVRRAVPETSDDCEHGWGLSEVCQDDLIPDDAFAEQDCEFAEYFFFKVVMADITRIPRPKVPGQPKLTGVKTLVLHKLLRYDEEARECLVSANALGNAIDDCATPYTMHPAMLPPEILSKVRKWSPTSTGITAGLRQPFKAHIPREQLDCLDEVVRGILRYPDGAPRDAIVPTHSLNPHIEKLVDAFFELGFLDGPPYKFTIQGEAALEIGISLGRPTYLLQRFDAFVGGDINKATLAELILGMEHDGWLRADLSTSRNALSEKRAWGKRAAIANPFRALADKKWYSFKAHSVSRYYLMALLIANEPMAGTHIHEVPHVGTNATYMEILGLQPPPGNAPAAIIGDVDWPEDSLPALKKAKTSKGVYLGGGGRKLKPSAGADDGVVVGSDDVDDGKGHLVETDVEDEHGNKYYRHISLYKYWNKVTGNHNGWNAYCARCGHSVGRAKCTKSHTVNGDGGDEGAQRRLLYWGSLGHTVDCKADHKELWSTVVTAWDNDEISDLAVLEVEACKTD